MFVTIYETDANTNSGCPHRKSRSVLLGKIQNEIRTRTKATDIGRKKDLWPLDRVCSLRETVCNTND